MEYIYNVSRYSNIESEEEWKKLSESEQEELIINFYFEESDQVVQDENCLQGWHQDCDEAISQIEQKYGRLPEDIRYEVFEKVNLNHKIGK